MLLRSFVDDYVTEAKTSRFTVRPFEYDPSGLASAAQMAAQSEVEYNKADAGIFRFCSTGFGEAFKAFMHVKVLRAYAESVLRYGPPTQVEDGVVHNFCPMLVKPNRNKELKTRDFLNKRYKDLFQDEADMKSDELDAYPYVILEA